LVSSAVVDVAEVSSNQFTGLLVLPYLFGAELWPNNIRSFGAALSQMFHWLFYFAVNKGVPSMLSSMDNWGTFLFFAGWCFIALVYVFVCVPETSGLSLEAIDYLFEGPFWQMTRRAKEVRHEAVDGVDIGDAEFEGKIEEVFGKQDKMV
jgi:hypothetical protein